MKEQSHSKTGVFKNTKTIIMFRTILSFCSTLAWAFSCAMLTLHLQYPVIIKKITIHLKLMLTRRKCTGFPVQSCLESLGWHCTRFLPVVSSIVPRVLRQHWAGFFHVQCCLELFWQHFTRFLPVRCWPKSIHYKNIEQDIFLCDVVWSLLDNITQVFLPVACYHKSVKTTLNKIFFFPM